MLASMQGSHIVYLTELIAKVVGFLVNRSVLDAVTTQQPHPPSAHIFLVPESPSWALSQSFRERLGLTLFN